jgi:HEAT repeat protein
MVHVRPLLLSLLLLQSAAVFAQASRESAVHITPDAAALARGWQLLSQRDAAGAARLARDLTARNPTSASALALLVEAEVARTGADAGLGAYEAWLGRRSVEDAYVLRWIAVALLRQTVQQTSDEAVRLLAIQALSADGDAFLGDLLASSQTAGAVARATGGDTQAIATLTAQVEEPGPMRIRGLAALAKTRNPALVAHVLPALADPDPLARTAAADALGELGAASAVPQLRGRLSDPVFSVRFAAARALSALNDNSGEAWLRTLLSSEHATIRVAAAEALKRAPEPDWLAQVRQLTADPDPSVRRLAAELIAPHDPELARATFERLLADSNPAERQAAQHTYVEIAVSNFGVLRRFLRSDDPGTRVRAATRMLELTR